MSVSRGRLTPVDVILFGVAVFILGNFIPPIYKLMNDNASSLGTPAAYLFQLVIPSLALSIMVVVYVTGATGGSA